MTSSWKRNGVNGLSRDEGVGVETAKGSWEAEADEDGLFMEGDSLKELVLEERRSSRDGGVIPSSLYSQSICTNVVDS